MHCKYLSVVPYKALEKFSKALYGTTGSTYSARVFRPLMLLWRELSPLTKWTHLLTANNLKADLHGTTLSHATSLRQAYDMNCFV